MDWITTSGRTLDEAKSNALDQLGIVADDAEFDVVNEVEKGLFGRVKSEAKIRARVRPKQPAAKEERSGRRRNGPGSNRTGGKPRGGRDDGKDGRNREKKSNNSGAQGASDRAGSSSKEDGGSSENNSGGNGGNRNKNRNRSRSGGGDRQGSSANAASKTEKKREIVDHEISREDQEQAANEFLEGVLGAFAMSGDVAVAQEAADDDAIEMVVTGDELGLLVGQKGVTLNALQELTRTVVQRKADGAKTDRLRVDVAGYRARRTAALQDFATKIAADVVDSGTEKLLEPMGPADRKVVHDTVNGIDGVETGSEGEEPRRRVVIRPV
ncbi:MAG: spoIIIJ-associated protein [Verrucomicrobiales bacterium]|jgi:spoIIIJ-associated protein